MPHVILDDKNSLEMENPDAGSSTCWFKVVWYPVRWRALEIVYVYLPTDSTNEHEHT